MQWVLPIWTSVNHLMLCRFACLSHKLEIRMGPVKTLEELTERQQQAALKGKVSGWVYERSSSRIRLGDGSHLIFS